MQTETRFLYAPHHETGELEMYLTLSRYSSNNRTAIQAMYYDPDCEIFMPYATLTVNLPDHKPSNPNCVFVDVNNVPWVLDLLISRLHVGELTSNIAVSGFCVYFEIELKPDALLNYIYNKE